MKKLFFTFCVLLIVSNCKKKAEFILPQIEDITESVYASGVVKSEGQYQVFATVTGTITEILVKEGDRVKKGDPILKITNTTASLNAENAKIVSDFSAENANQERLNELSTAIALAKTKMELDGSVFLRQKTLWDQNIGTQIEFEQRQLAYKNSVSAYETAMLRFKQLQKQIAFQAKQSRKNLEIANKLTADFVVRSNADGMVYNLTKEKGEMVSPTLPIATIGQPDAFVVELQVDEFDISKMLLGQKIWINMDSYKGQVFEAELVKIYPIMNERSKSFQIDARFIKNPSKLYPNLTCEANILISQKTQALTIPRSYLLDGDYVLGENNEKIKVNTGLKDFQKVEILSGITKNDPIYKPNI